MDELLNTGVKGQTTPLRVGGADRQHNGDNIARQTRNMREMHWCNNSVQIFPFFKFILKLFHKLGIKKKKSGAFFSHSINVYALSSACIECIRIWIIVKCFWCNLRPIQTFALKLYISLWQVSLCQAVFCMVELMCLS